ncbi:hypothetical protein C8263_16300 [Deinococcus arcticus]|uniref:Cytochrome c domain-containing protein n=1 Tax=Deinococcus arcticus TaxID=2136176 RepID=A0A2T3W497_9DEIO|nr:hypothetical protein C8263_16300 [Deinococcus arcticus]
MKAQMLLLTGVITAPFVTVNAPQLGLPPLRPISQAQVQLGQAIFFSPSASADARISCASCHDPQQAFADGRPVARGVQGLLGTRNSPSLKNAAWTQPLMWDGRRATLEDQVMHPFTTAREHGMTSTAQAIEALNSDPAVQRVAQRALNEMEVKTALTAFITSLARGNSAFDRMMYAGQAGALTPEQKRGFELFKKTGCIACHATQAGYATFTDGQYHYTHQLSVIAPLDLAARLKQARQIQPADLDEVVTQQPELAVLGRFLVTQDKHDIGAMKTPSLRDAARTAPYFHDGSTQTLDAAVRQELAYRSAQTGAPITLDDQEIQAIVRFIESLNSGN